ncbi:MAG TPA: PilZ domain-containing protein [Rhizomicrobium sp.]|nr:PilZ domain-containing protein [Rhizomicrobium sp.]
MKSNAQSARSLDQRSSDRVQVRLAGKLFVPAENTTLDCTVVNLSIGGAGLYCPEPPPLDAFTVLYVDGFGRFDAVTTRYVKGELGLKFVCKEARIKKLADDLAAFVKHGMTGYTRLRRHGRKPAETAIDFFTLADGSPVKCRVLDISFQGAMLETALRPAVGELIQLGQTKAWVVRHHQEGIGVQFLQACEADDGR